MRAAPVGSWAIAVCVCVDCLIYLYITARHCTLVPGSTPARASAARWHGSIRLIEHSQKGPSRAPKRLICTDKPHAIRGPRFPRYLCLSSGAELTPASVNPGMPNARTHPPHCRQRAAVPHRVRATRCAMPPLLRCQLVSGHVSSRPLSLCIACSALSHQASLSPHSLWS